MIIYQFLVINYKGWCYAEDVYKETIRRFTDENMHALNDYLIVFDWTTITSSTDVDECSNLFINEIINAINFYCRIKKVPLSNFT